jgi:outer membrane protein assembly factor BamB
MDGERVYVPLRGDWLMALDRETGTVAWTRTLDASTAPVVSEGRVFLVSRESVRALDAVTGDDVWETPLPQKVTAPLMVESGWLVAIAEPGIAIALRTSDGEEVWRRSLRTSSQHAPVLGEKNALYFSLADGRVLALRVADGMPLWEQKLPGMLSEPAVAPDRVFIGSTDNFFYAFDADDGEFRWKWRGGGDVIGAAFDGKLVYFASLDNIIRAVNPGNGNQRWKKETASRPVLPPRAMGGIVVLPGLTPSITAFAAKTGAPLGTYIAQSPTGATQPLLGPPLIDPALPPFRVSIVTITRDGLIEGLRSTGLMFREAAAVAFGSAFPTLPGRPVTREQPQQPALSSAPLPGAEPLP